MTVTAASARRAPHERNALRSALPRSRTVHDRVFGLQRSAGNRAVAQLARAPAPGTDAPTLPRLTIDDLKIPVPANCDQTGTIRDSEMVKGDPESRKVTLGDGSVYLVKRKRRVEFTDHFIPQPPSLSTGSDADKVWVQLDWCGGSHGTIKLGANPQQAGNEAIKAIEDTISNGGSAKDALDAASKTKVTPFLDFDIGSAGSWRVTGHAEVTVNREGFQGATGKLDVHVGPVHIKPGVTLDEKGHPTGGSLDFEFGDSPPAVKCKDKQRLYARQSTTYEWTPWIPEHDEKSEIPYSREAPSDYYLYFKYATPNVDEKLSEKQHDLLVAELQRGGHVTGITAHTSPEGSHEQQGKQWMGNTELAKERASAAETWVRSAITRAGAGSIDTTAKVEPAAEAELYTLSDAKGKDVEGRDLEENAEAMFGVMDAEDRHRAEVDEELAKGPKSGRKRAEIVYKRLRRADITVTRTESGVTPHVEHVPGKWRDAPVPCSPVPDAEIAKQYPQFNFN
jgi:hypothetical protein